MSISTSRQFLRFSLVGVLNSLIQYAVFVLLLKIAGLYYLTASVIGYACGMVNSYLVNRRWTYAARNPTHVAEFTRFVVVNLTALVVNTLILRAAVARMGVRPEVGQLLAIAGSMAIGFVGNKLWTFKQAVPEATS